MIRADRLFEHLGVAWCVAAPAALIGASNFYKLAVAAATSPFGLDSGAGPPPPRACSSKFR